jgi:hypothetical protein
VLFLLFAAPLFLINGQVYREKKEYESRLEFDFNVAPMEQKREVVLKITYNQLTPPVEGQYRAVLIYPSGRRDSLLFSLPDGSSDAQGGKNWVDRGSGNVGMSRAHMVKLFDVGEENGEHRVIVREKNSDSIRGICMTVSIWVGRRDESPGREESRETPWI